MKLGLALLCMITGPAFAANTARSEMGLTRHLSCNKGGGFLPENNLYLEDRINNDSGINEAQFNALVDKALSHYGPIVREHGFKLEINRLWSDSTVNAYAYQSDTKWSVDMFGGLARRPEADADGIALVLCHEIGHHLGGWVFNEDLMANEGQSDYFATQSCAREIWKNETEENAKARATVPEKGKDLCDSVWETESDQNLCYRIMKGSESISRILVGVQGGSINWDRKDKTVVSRTNFDHPKTQCRFDTYQAGAICTKTFDQNLIPGKEFGLSSNWADAERASYTQSCASSDGFSIGTRPLCWFKPLID